jgi:uncharacterized caspase-like protein
MVTRAEELKAALVKSGFPERNIQTFYDEKATAVAINGAIEQFWQGELHADADRLFIYFGGHGAGEVGRGFLVTYDFDPQRPTRTGLLMSDFVGRHFPNIVAQHVFVALDACSSGLSIPGRLGDRSEDELERFATLASIEKDRSQVARNMLVAGTGKQPAFAKDGGYFTQALIRGLSSEADIIKDGVIQFDELSLYVKRQVTAQVGASGERQSPKAFDGTQFGEGKVLFLPERR